MTPTPTSHAKPALNWLLRRARTARLWIALSLALGVAGGLLLIVQAALIARIIQAVLIDGLSRSDLNRHFVCFALVVAGRAVLAWGRELSGFQAGARVRAEVRLDLIDHMAAAGPAFTRRRRTGAIASSVLEQVEALHDFFAYYLPQLGLAVLVPLSILAVVFPISWSAGLILTATAPLIPLFMILVGMGAESISQKQFQALSRMSAHFLDVLQGLPTLKRFDRSREEAQRVRAVSRDYRRRTMRVLRVAFLSAAVLEFFSAIAIALVAVYLGTHFLGYVDFGTYGKPLTLGAGLFILVLAPDFYLPLRELGTHYHARAAAVGAAEDIMRILAAPLPPPPAGTTVLERSQSPTITFDHVTFAFDANGRPALRDIDVTFRPRESVVLTGASGAGKTTLLDLLLRFHAPGSGTIYINGTPLEHIPAADWRRMLAWVGQRPYLFYGSLRDNIRLGRPGAGETAIQAAVRAARVDEFAHRLPRGLDAPVGEKGGRLSRGQAQRVALARAFLADAPLLLLDEPTAGLDRFNEHLVAAAIASLSRGRTVITVTHRLDHIRTADRILTLDQGTIVEDGRYSALMAARGPLFHLLQVPGGRRP